MKIMIGDGEKTNISVLNDPFKVTNITSINLHYSKIMFEKVFAWEATISFTNGDTSGRQKFEVRDEEGKNSFEIITKQVQEFINSLK